MMFNDFYRENYTAVLKSSQLQLALLNAGGHVKCGAVDETEERKRVLTETIANMRLILSGKIA